MSTNFSESGYTDNGRRHPNTLISADKVHGTDVYNHAGDRLGSVDSVMIDKINGEVAYVVMSFGGFLGIGEKYHPLPWDVLDYDTSLGGYRVDLDREALTNAPAYDRENIDSYDYDAADIDDFYASTPRSARYDAANRDADLERGTAVNKTRDQHGFYSPEQQQKRNLGESGDGHVVGPDGQESVQAYEASHRGEGLDTRRT